MVNDVSADNKEATYIKIANFPGLYRHTRSGRYYGAKKLRGKRRECSLRTTDRKIAERRLRDWMRNLTAVDHGLERMTLRELIIGVKRHKTGTFFYVPIYPALKVLLVRLC